MRVDSFRANLNSHRLESKVVEETALKQARIPERHEENIFTSWGYSLT